MVGGFLDAPATRVSVLVSGNEFTSIQKDMIEVRRTRVRRLVMGWTGVRGVKAFYLSQHHTYQIKSFSSPDGHEHGDLKPLFIPSLTSTPE